MEKKQTENVWINKGREDLFETFAVEMQEFPETGKLPESCDRNMQYCMELQMERQNEKGVFVKDQFVPRGNFANVNSEVFRYEDDKFRSKVYARSCRFEKRVYKGKKVLFSYSENRNLYQTIVYSKDDRKVEEEDYVCPNCGAVSKVKELINGCDYCSTRFKMDELFPKVTNFFMLMDFGRTRKEVVISLLKTVFVCIFLSVMIAVIRDYVVNGGFILSNIIWIFLSGFFGGGLFGYFIWAILQVLSIFVAAHKSFATNFTAAGSAARFERQMKEYTPDFSYAYFTGKVISLLRMIMYVQDAQTLPMYAGAPLGDLFADVVDAHYRGALALKRFKVDGDYCYVTVDAYMEVLHAGSRMRKKNEVYRVVLRKNVTTPLDVNFSISKIHCKNCNASFDATKLCNCPSCGTKYEVEDEDWVVMSVERKVVVL